MPKHEIRCGACAHYIRNEGNKRWSGRCVISDRPVHPCWGARHCYEFRKAQNISKEDKAKNSLETALEKAKCRLAKARTEERELLVMHLEDALEKYNEAVKDAKQ